MADALGGTHDGSCNVVHSVVLLAHGMVHRLRAVALPTDVARNQIGTADGRSFYNLQPWHGRPVGMPPRQLSGLGYSTVLASGCPGTVRTRRAR